MHMINAKFSENNEHNADEGDDMRCDIDLNAVPYILLEDSTLFKTVTENENLNHRITKEDLEAVTTNTVDRDFILYTEAPTSDFKIAMR